MYHHFLHGACSVVSRLLAWGAEATCVICLQTAVATVAARGVVFVSSAGNDHTDNDVQPHWPSNLETDTTISVAALDTSGALW